MALFDSWSLIQKSNLNNFFWVCWFLGKNLSNFVSPVWKLHNPYCHNVDPNCQTTYPPLLVTMVFKTLLIYHIYVLIQFPYVVWRISCENQEFLQLKLDWKKEVFGHKGCNFDLSHFGWLGLSKSLEVWHFAAAELSKRQTEAESYFICSLSLISNNFDNGGFQLEFVSISQVN